MSPPDFTNTALFPTFNDLPESTSPPPPTNPTTTTTRSSQDEPTLLAQIKDDMTITKPTLIVTDRSAHPFALIFDGFDREEGIRFLKGKGLNKKGCTVVLGDGLARKTPPREDSKSGKGFVRVPRGREEEVGVVSGSLERVLEVGGWLGNMLSGGEQGEEEGKCDGCGGGKREDGSKGLLKCTGCGVAKYCSKECQIKGWNEAGHKADCKVIKGIIGIWGR